jgi:hypothetical protein
MSDVRLGSATLNGDSRKVTLGIPEGTWVATLSDGSTIVENTGDFQIVEGERKPWVRLCKFLGDSGLWLTSLRFNYRGRTVHLPRMTLDKFGMTDRIKPPLYYSLQYHHEAELSLGGVLQKEWIYVDLASHYQDFAVHFIQDVSNGDNSWIAVTDPDALAPTPRRKDLLPDSNN